MELVFKTFKDPITPSKNRIQKYALYIWYRYKKDAVFQKILSLKCTNIYEADFRITGYTVLYYEPIVTMDKEWSTTARSTTRHTTAL